MHYVERARRYLSLFNEKSVKSQTPVTDIYYFECGYKKPGELPDFNDKRFKPFGSEDYWGGKKDGHAWFKFSVKAPCSGAYRLHVRTDRTGWDAINPQLMAYVNGKLTQGLDTNHLNVYVNGDCNVMLYAYTGPGISAPLKLYVDLQEMCEATESFYFDLFSPIEVLDFTDVESSDYSNILSAVNKAIETVDCREFYSDNYYATLKKAAQTLKEEFYGKVCNPRKEKVAMLGHSHIDTAWRWTVAQTEEKVQRTFSTVLNLMDKYPEFKFFASQPVQYEMFKRQQPELYEKLRERVKEGRWEPEGGMWVEADCNLSSGESLIRQFLYGKRFIKQEFDIDSKILWLPDVFGYNAAMPQILRKCGIDTFVTAKITWNDVNRMPCDTFVWKGIDGSEVLTYFITTQQKTKGPSVNYCSYVGPGTPHYVAGTYTRYTNKELTNEVLMTCGWGDGGGGPTREFNENIRRMGYGIPNCPVAEPSRADDFILRLKESLKDKRVPQWRGELYLEFHRGTYTSIAKNKRHNRKCEYKLQTAEQLAAIANCRYGIEYPVKQLDDCWKTVLLNQFHDILPGSSIKEVYDDTDVSYAQVHKTLDTLIKNSASALLNKGKSGGYVAFNSHSFDYNGYVKNEEDGKYYYVSIPSKGYAPVALNSESGVTVKDLTIENKYYAVKLNKEGYIFSIFDKCANRQVLSGEAGLFVYEDYPYDYDAWELCDYYSDKRQKPEGKRTIEPFEENGRAGYLLTVYYGNSVIRQKIALYVESRRIEFDCKCDWYNEHNVLRAEFPLAINSYKATFDIQFGAFERSATMNNPWERAQFEVCAHKFADYSEYGYGAALISDCKYGYSAKNGVLSLTLIKCPTDPNPQADKGEHEFVYALMPHKGDYKQAGVLQEAYMLNLPAALYLGKAESFSLLKVSEPSVIAETVKKSEDNKGITVRAYEAFGLNTSAEFKTGVPIKKVYLCDMLENELYQIPCDKNGFKFEFTPYSIETFKIITD